MGNHVFVLSLNSSQTMVKYWPVAVCKNGSHNRPNLSYFCVPSDQKLRKKWETLCRRADEKFKMLADPRIFSQHFSREDLKRTLPRKIEIISCGVPTIFDPKQPAAKSDPRQERKTGGIVEHNSWQIIQQSYC